MSERIAIVGASVRAAAASALRAGFRPVVADQFADEDLVRIAPTTRITNYPHGFVEWLRQLMPPPATWMYTGALENYPDLVAEMAAICPLWGNHGSLLRAVRSPWRLAEALGEAGLLFPETRSSPAGLPPDGSWLVKTGRGASGSGVKRLLGEDLGGAVPASVYQRRVAGESASAVYVAAGGAAELLGVVHQLVGRDWLGAREFQYCGAIGPFRCSDSTLAEIERIGNVLADRFELVGLFGVDLVIGGHRVWTIEVNPRYTASVEIVERSTGFRAISAHADACTLRHRSPRSIPKDGNACGKAILFAKRRVTISAKFAEWADGESRAADWPRAADLSSAGTIIPAGRPIMTVFASGATSDKVKDQLQGRVAEVDRALYGKQPARK